MINDTKAFEDHFEGVGSKYWQTFIVQNIDYIANPAIQVKNYRVISNLMANYIPVMEENNEWFDGVKKYTEKLMVDCYGIQVYSNSLDKNMTSFFE